MPLLEGDEREKLIAAVVEAFPSLDELDYAVIMCLDKHLHVIVDASGGTQIVAYRLIDWCERNDTLVALMEKLPGQTGNRTLSALCPQLLSALRQRQPTPLLQPVSPYEALVVRMTEMFIDRKKLREYLRQMDQSNGFRILAVNGDRGVGKSHSLHLVSYVVDRRKPARIAFVNSTQSQSKRIEPDTMIRSLALQLGFGSQVASIPDQVSKSERWVWELAEWLAGVIRQADGLCWIVLDGFDDAAIPTSTSEGIHHLTRLARTNSLLRIVLLHYRRDRLPVDVQRGVREEVVSAASRVDLVEFFTHMKQQLGNKATGVDPAQLADDVWGQVKHLQGTPEFMSVLADRTIGRFQELFPEEF